MKAFLALGSNLADPIQQIQTALIELNELPYTSLKRASSLYLNPPIGKLDQPDFINAVAEIETELSAIDLLTALLELEKKHQRIRKEKNGPRTLDLDILLYGQCVINTASLQVPHPRLTERPFVVIPLAEIAPGLMFPCGTAIDYWLNSYKDHRLTIVN